MDEARATAPRLLEKEGAIAPEAAAALPGVASVESEDRGETRRIRATLKAGGAGHETLRAAFVQGLDVRTFQMREPSLHDAFIGLTGQDPEQDQGQGREEERR